MARDTSGKPISNNLNLIVKFSIYSQGGSGGTPLYTETNNGVPTNRYGLFTLRIGSVDTLSFDAINWASGNKFLEVSITDGGTVVTMPRTQMMSVP